MTEIDAAATSTEVAEMNTSGNAWIRVLSSQDCGQRLLAWDIFYGDWARTQLYRYFRFKTGSHEDAECLTSEIYFRIRQHLAREPLPRGKEWNYIMTAAKNLFIEHQRREKRKQRAMDAWQQSHSLYDDRPLTPEEQFALKDMIQSAFDLVLRIPAQRDRILMLLHCADVKPKHIPKLLPTFNSMSTVHTHLRKARTFLRKQLRLGVAAYAFPSPWEDALRFTGSAGAFGVNMVNYFPTNFAPQVQEYLCDRFSIDDFNDLPERFVPALSIHNIRTVAMELRVVFMPREDVDWGLLAGNPVNYFDARAVFHKGHLYLEDAREYQAKAVGRIKEDGITVGTEWRYELPSGPLAVRKPYNERLFPLYSNPQTQTREVFAFQPEGNNGSLDPYP